MEHPGAVKLDVMTACLALRKLYSPDESWSRSTKAKGFLSLKGRKRRLTEAEAHVERRQITLLALYVAVRRYACHRPDAPGLVPSTKVEKEGHVGSA